MRDQPAQQAQVQPEQFPQQGPPSQPHEQGQLSLPQQQEVVALPSIMVRLAERG